MGTRREESKKQARRTSAKTWAEEKDKGFEPTCIKLPKGMEFFKLDKVGEIVVDFMPFLAGAHNRYADQGIDHYHAYYESHRVPTANGTWPYTCRGFFGEKCAVCDWIKKYGMDSGHKKVAGEMKAKTRILWLVNDKPGDEDNPLKVFDSNDWAKGLGFGEQMKRAVGKTTRRDDVEDVFTLKGGYSAELEVAQQPGWEGGKPYNAVVRIDLVKRKYDYPKSMLANAPCLDDMIVDPGYESVKKILAGGNSEEEEEEAPKGRSTSRGVTVEEEKEEMPKAKSKKSREEPEEDDEEKDELDEEPPTKSTKATSSKKPKEDEWDDIDEDEDEGEEEKPPPKKKK